MIDRATIIGMKNGFRSDNDLRLALEIVSQGGAEVMGLQGYGVTPGCKADFTLLDGQTVAHAVVNVAPRPLVVKGGRVVARAGLSLMEAP